MDNKISFDKKIEPIIMSLLEKRGLTDEDDIAEFLSKKPKKTYDPFLLPDMEAGVDLLLSKINAGAKICIYGDYDADGITSISLLTEILTQVGKPEQFSYYIPSRFEEGYGLNCDAIDSLASSGVDMILTVDCGSVSYEEVEHAKSLGLDIIVTDHHSIAGKTADCININPKRNDSAYPCPYLAGVGVAFKLAQAVQKKVDLPKAALIRVLDLVALGTVGDIVPLLDENRTIVKCGLSVLRRGERPGLRRLIEAISLKPETVTESNIAFAIVPHINAAGRMLNAKVGAELMLAKDTETIERCVETLIMCNSERRAAQEDLYMRCVEMIETERAEGINATEKPKDESDISEKGESAQAMKAVLLFVPDAHEGIAGIVAGKLKDKYKSPTVLMTPSGDDGEYLKGTGRSIEKIDLYRLLKKCEDLFERFGGHAGACGFLMKREHLEEFRKRINDALSEMESEDSSIFDVETRVDGELTPKLVTFELADAISLLAPFGHKNPRPVFRIRGVSADHVTLLGDGEKHVRFVARDRDGKGISCIFFNRANEVYDILKSGRRFDILGEIEKEIWNGNMRLQFVVSEIEAE